MFYFSAKQIKRFSFSIQLLRWYVFPEYPRPSNLQLLEEVVDDGIHCKEKLIIILHIQTGSSTPIDGGK